MRRLSMMCIFHYKKRKNIKKKL